MEESTILHAEKLLRQKPGFEASSVAEVSHLAGDASLRSYTRLRLQNAPAQSVILMELKGGMGPAGGGPGGLTQNDTFVELAGFLREHGIEAPLILVDARENNFLLVEDVGDVCLAEASTRHADRVTDLYRKAIDLIIKLQSIPRVESSVAFQRSPSLDQLKNQASEFVDHYSLPRGLRDPDRRTLSSFIDRICEVVNNHPKVLTHYDYTAWNLFVDSSGAIRPLDFQDACLESPARDIVALIDDRDSDAVLGPERHAELFDYFCSFFADREKAQQWYYEYRIHWHLRVTGRFALLSEKRGLPKYAAWIPGSVRRLVSTLEKVGDSIPESREVMGIILSQPVALR